MTRKKKSAYRFKAPFEGRNFVTKPMKCGYRINYKYEIVRVGGR